MKLFHIVDRLFARRFIRGSESRIRNGGNTMKEQAYYYYFS